MNRLHPALLTFFAAAGIAGAALAAGKAPARPATSIRFLQDVKPVLAHHCFSCHARDKRAGGLSLESRELALKGGESGPALVPGKSAASELLRRVTHADPARRMPPGKPLKGEEIALLKAWIDAGAPWDESKPVEKPGTRNVLPRKPVVPPGPGNPVDRLLAGSLKKAKVAPAQIDDRTFARRVYLDVVGLPPTPEELGRFLTDPGPDRRTRLVRELLADSPRYADHWMTFWQDHLRDGIKDIGSTDVFRTITPWLHHSLLTNKPYDVMVRELITAAPPREDLDENEREKLDRTYTPDKNDASGFLAGLMPGLEVPRGDQAWPVQAAQNIGQVFLGVQLKCATCHDSFVDGWKMEDTWSLANVLAEQPLEAVRCEIPTGKKFAPRFLLPQVGRVDPNAPRAERQQQLADLITSPRNGRFSRTVVNRLWARLMGEGLVQRVDEMDGAAWNPDLLDYLAGHLVENGHDLKKTLELILTSQAYQRPAVDYPRDAPYVFRGPKLRRLTAEQFVDSLYLMLGRKERAWRENGSRLMELLGRPDRRVVVTSRDSRASTMQALELLNGAALWELLYTSGPAPRLTADSAEKQAKQPQAAARERGPNAHLAALAALPKDELGRKLWLQALSREPSPRELAALNELLGEKSDAAGVGDALWAVVMLPEFQLVR